VKVGRVGVLRQDVEERVVEVPDALLLRALEKECKLEREPRGGG